MQYVWVREKKTCKQNKGGHIYTERERERDKERLGDRERGSTHEYVHECVKMFACMFGHT
jgi:hypothetical protein